MKLLRFVKVPYKEMNIDIKYKLELYRSMDEE